MFRRLRDKKGFTIIELMIVVGIIGVLASVAIPTFMGYQTKTRQSEAKINLSQIYVAETTHLTEYNRFVPDLREAGFSLIGNKALIYDFTATGPYTTSGTPPDVTASWYLGDWVGLHGPLGPPDGFQSTTMPGTTDIYFTAVAVGNADNDPTMDVWTLNKNRDLVNVVDDTLL
ncbi:MAG TPA: prepilin-type N-terminal cleavage/methylation domain-containing protein [Nitrospirota bacterium]|jgi:prepilin-type N-terminal cleavage/methylation domain-containing protein